MNCASISGRPRLSGECVARYLLGTLSLDGARECGPVETSRSRRCDNSPCFFNDARLSSVSSVWRSLVMLPPYELDSTLSLFYCPLFDVAGVLSCRKLAGTGGAVPAS